MPDPGPCHDNWGMRIMHTLEDHHGVMRVPAGAASEAQACRAVRRGLVIRPLPGVIMDGALAGHPGAWLRAVHLWRPDAVLDGRAALASCHVPLPGGEGIERIDVRLDHHLPDRGLLRFHRGTPSPPHRHVTAEATCVHPAVAVLGCAARVDWEPLFHLFRQRIVTIDEPRAVRAEAARLHGRGPVDQVLRLVRDEPWSMAELELHRLLREARVRGWRANAEIRADDHDQVADLLFDDEHLVVEVDSYSFHGSRDAYEATMRRAARIGRGGWTVLHVTPAMIRVDPRAVLELICTRLHRRHRPVALPTNAELRRGRLPDVGKSP